MSHGYSQELIKANKKASSLRKLQLGVSLGKHCIEAGVPVSEVALELNVSRATIYNWFKGTSQPYQYQHLRIKDYIEFLRKRKQNVRPIRHRSTH